MTLHKGSQGTTSQGTTGKTESLLVKDVMTRDVHTCSPKDNLHRAAKLMWDGDIGCVPVVEAGSRLVAMITDRDLCMAAYHKDARLHELFVSEAMSRTVYFVRESQPIAAVEETMRERQVRRVPVVDEQQRLVGIVSLNDLALHQGDRRNGEIASEEVAETLKAVCEPHRKDAAEGSRITAGT